MQAKAAKDRLVAAAHCILEPWFANPTALHKQEQPRQALAQCISQLKSQNKRLFAEGQPACTLQPQITRDRVPLQWKITSTQHLHLEEFKRSLTMDGP